MMHPPLGFAANFVFVALPDPVPHLGRLLLLPVVPCRPSPGCSGRIWATRLLDLADYLTQPLAVFIVSEIFVVGFGLLFIFRNTRAVLQSLPLHAPGQRPRPAGLLRRAAVPVDRSAASRTSTLRGRRRRCRDAAEVGTPVRPETGFAIHRLLAVGDPAGGHLAVVLPALLPRVRVLRRARCGPRGAASCWPVR